MGIGASPHRSNYPSDLTPLPSLVESDSEPMKKRNRRRKTGKSQQLKATQFSAENLEERCMLAGDTLTPEKLYDQVIGAGNIARKDALIDAEIVVREIEQEDDRGDDRILNNDPASAEFLPLGFGAGQHQAIDILGRVIEGSVGTDRSSEVAVAGANPPVVVRDDGSIETANDVNHSSGNLIEFEGFLGDSTLGFNAGAGLGGDVDFYELEDLEPGQWVTAHAENAPFSVLALYDEFGTVIESTEMSPAIDNYIFHEIEEAGNYYVAIMPFATSPGNFLLPTNPISGPSSAQGGPGAAYTLTLGVDAGDPDFYSFDLMPGDIIGFNGIGSTNVLGLRNPDGELMLQTSDDASGLFPLASPLPGGGTSSLAYVIDTPGRYRLSVNGYDFGNYKLEARVFRPAAETLPEGDNQILFLDFDGALVNPELVFFAPNAVDFIPFSNFVPNWGVDQNQLISAIVREIERMYVTDLQKANPNVKFTVMNSRDHADPFGQPNVSRIIVGGTQAQLGTAGGLLGIAESIDVGNFDMSETALAMMDILAGPRDSVVSLNHYDIAPGARKVDFVAQGIAWLIAHEAAHIFGGWHTSFFNSTDSIIDQSFDLTNITGPDLVFGTHDDNQIVFANDIYTLTEGFTGVANTLDMFANIFIPGQGGDFVPTQTLTGLVFHDIDGDGAQDDGEGGFAGARVYVDTNNDGEFGIGEPAAVAGLDGTFTIPGVGESGGPVRAVELPGQVVTTPADNGIELSSDSFVFGIQGATGTTTGTDFGDAPLTYGIASHQVQPGIMLGASIDGEEATQVDDGSDDDGVSLTGLLAGGTGSGTVSATTGTLPAAVVNGWIDFNGDGAFDASEQIVSDLELNGSTNFTFPVPAGSMVGDTWARFRYGYDRGIAPTGTGRAGEVEDYAVNITSTGGGGGTGGGDGGGGGTTDVAPEASNDIFSVDQDSVDNSLNVFSNDSSGTAAVTLSVGATSQGGSVSVNGLNVIYTPPAGFSGVETFTYTLTSSVGSDTATVSVDVEEEDITVGDPIVGYRVEITDTDDQPVTDLAVGDEFLVNVYADDLRTDGGGVWAAYVDVSFNEDIASPNGDVTFGDEYPEGRSPRDGVVADDTNGLLDEYGAWSGSFSFSDIERLVFSVPMVATGNGTLVFETSFADLERSETLVFDIPTQAVPEARIQYGSASVTIGEDTANASFTNPLNRFDVNNNGTVEPRDALTLINEINTNGARNLVTSTAPIADGFFLDVNGDDNLSAIDVLNVISFLNGMLFSSGEPAAAVAAAAAVDTDAVDSVFEADDDDEDISVFDII